MRCFSCKQETEVTQIEPHKSMLNFAYYSPATHVEIRNGTCCLAGVCACKSSSG
jgi:hypothetical protein